MKTFHSLFPPFSTQSAKLECKFYQNNAVFHLGYSYSCLMIFLISCLLVHFDLPFIQIYYVCLFNLIKHFCWKRFKHCRLADAMMEINISTSGYSIWSDSRGQGQYWFKISMSIDMILQQINNISVNIFGVPSHVSTHKAYFHRKLNYKFKNMNCNHKRDGKFMNPSKLRSISFCLQSILLFSWVALTLVDDDESAWRSPEWWIK